MFQIVKVNSWLSEEFGLTKFVSCDDECDKPRMEMGKKKRKNLLVDWIEANKGDKSLLQGFPLSQN